jgi:hypothetical protein
MAKAPPDLGWSENERSQGHDVELRRPRTAATVLLVVSLAILAIGVANAVSIYRATDAIDAAYYPRSRLWRTSRSGPIAAIPWIIGAVCFVVAWRAVGRLRDVPKMRIDRSGFTLEGSLILPRRDGFHLSLAEISKFELLPAGFSTDVIPLGGGWDVRVTIRGGAGRRLRLPLDDLTEAEFVVARLNHFVAAGRR